MPENKTPPPCDRWPFINDERDRYLPLDDAERILDRDEPPGPRRTVNPDGSGPLE